MVVAHALVKAEQGQDVTVIIDDRAGARMAAVEASHLDHRRATGTSVGRIRLVDTVTILEAAARKGLVPGRSQMRDIYGRLRGLDDGLAPIETTPLMDRRLWAPSVPVRVPADTDRSGVK